MEKIGKKVWVIPDMYWPDTAESVGPYVCHEAVCVLNTATEDCEVSLTLYYEDAEPIRDIKVVCPAERTVHIRMDRLLHDNRHLRRGAGYSALVRCSIPAVVQYTRVDTTQQNFSLASSMAYAVD